MKQIFIIAAFFSLAILSAGENLVKSENWKFNRPAQTVRQADGVFRMTAPDDKTDLRLLQTITLDRQEIVPIRFGATFRTVSGNRYSRVEDTYGLLMNLRYTDGTSTNYISVGATPGKQDWESIARTYVPKRPVAKAEIYARLAKRSAVVEVKDIFLKELVPPPVAEVTDHGIAAEACELRHAIAGKDAAGRPFVIGAMLDAGPDRYILYTELDTGKTFQHVVPGWQRGFFSGAVLTPSGKYVTGLAGKVVIFDVNTRKLTLSKSVIGSTCWSAAIGTDGMVYLGNVPCTLVAVNPETGEVKNCGRMDPVETQLYWIASDKTGWVYCGTGVARSGVTAYNFKTGEKKELVPEAFRKLGSGYVADLPDGTVYINTPSGFSAICEGGEFLQTPVHSRPKEADRPHLKYGSRKFRISENQRIISYNNHKNEIVWNDKGVLKSVPYTYRSGGASITSLATGPDGKVYISTAHPHHLASLDPQTGKITDHGYNPTVGGGNFCNMTSFKGKLYTCEYSHGRMWELDTAKPVTYTERSFFGVPMTTLVAQIPASEQHQFNILGEILLCMGKENGAPFRFRVPVKEDGKGYINMRFYHFQTYGIVTVKVLDKTWSMDLARDIAGLSDMVSMGPFDFKKGDVPVEISVCKSPKGKYPWFGLTGLEAATAPRQDNVGRDNPRILGRWPKAVMRPRTIQVHPNGREVMMAGFSYDGMKGGQFGIHDLQTGKNSTIADWLPGESCIAAEFEKNGDLIGGSSIAAIGGHSTVKEACVFRMDWKTKKVVNIFRCPRAGNVNAIALWRGKILAATDNSILYVIDPATFKSVASFSIGYPVRRAFQQTADGRMFLIQSRNLSELDPVTFKPTAFAQSPAGISAGGAIAGNRIIFAADGRKVFSCAIPAKRK
ncbi:MAG: PQQ-like beta-propeller repeat protein [Lentisphaeria bacterium]|nr:PQQ-like beta-propeller repeat protein [Lentisphaeria bacterium]